MKEVFLYVLNLEQSLAAGVDGLCSPMGTGGVQTQGNSSGSSAHGMPLTRALRCAESYGNT